MLTFSHPRSYSNWFYLIHFSFKEEKIGILVLCPMKTKAMFPSIPAGVFEINADSSFLACESRGGGGGYGYSGACRGPLWLQW